jgi:hypothetical protein
LVTQLSHHSWFGAELVEGGRAGSHKTTVPFHATWLDDRSVTMWQIEKVDYLHASNTAMHPSQKADLYLPTSFYGAVEL